MATFGPFKMPKSISSPSDEKIEMTWHTTWARTDIDEDRRKIMTIFPILIIVFLIVFYFICEEDEDEDEEE